MKINHKKYFNTISSTNNIEWYKWLWKNEPVNFFYFISKDNIKLFHVEKYSPWTKLLPDSKEYNDRILLIFHLYDESNTTQDIQKQLIDLYIENKENIRIIA